MWNEPRKPFRISSKPTTNQRPYILQGYVNLIETVFMLGLPTQVSNLFVVPSVEQAIIQHTVLLTKLSKSESTKLSLEVKTHLPFMNLKAIYWI